MDRDQPAGSLSVQGESARTEVISWRTWELLPAAIVASVLLMVAIAIPAVLEIVLKVTISSFAQFALFAVAIRWLRIRGQPRERLRG